MSVTQAAILALVQGLTEFLPISSSAHLILVPHLLGWEDQGLTFDLVVHLGTLTAVCAYFRHDLARITGAWIGSVSGRGFNTDARLAWFIGIGTIPVGLAGLAFKDWVSGAGRDPMVIGLASVVFGLLLWWADKAGTRARQVEGITWKDAIAVGCAQALALIPGTSRSGITMTAGLALGLTRQGAARFSFLLSIPVIALSGGLGLADLVTRGPDLTRAAPLVTGFAVSAISAYLCIKLFLGWLDRHAMTPFVIYRVALGLILIGFAL